MGRFTEKEVFCKECGAALNAKLYPCIRVPRDLHLRSKLLDSTLLNFECPSCGCAAQLSYPLLYSDIQRGFMVYLIPGVEKFCTVDSQLEEEYRELPGIIRRAVPDLNSLKEKIYCFENCLDDMALELTKLAISRAVADKFGVKRVEKGYLSMYDTGKNTIGFTFFVGDSGEAYLQSARLELYAKSLRIANKTAARDKARRGFLKIDREWADNIIYRYNAENNRWSV